MKIAIIAAMEEEVQLLLRKLENGHIENYLGIDFHLGQLSGHDIIVLQSGIGKVAAAATTTLLLTRYSIDAVINTGSAGGLHSSLNIGDIIISTDVTYYDADVTAFGYHMGQMPNCPVTFPVSKDYQQLAIKSALHHKLNAVTGLICSGDTFVHRPEQRDFIRTYFPDAIAVEMEAAAIGHVCWLMGIPFVIVRSISDVADKKSIMNFEEFLPLAVKYSTLIVENMLKLLSDN